MKKVLLFAAVLISISFNGYSQCTPDVTITKPGITPDSATNLPHAFVGVPYSAVMQVRAPQDTSTVQVILGNSYTVAVTVDTIFLQSLTGFPNGGVGWSYSCYPNAGCYFLGNSNGCVAITGPAPLLADVGQYPLTAIVRGSAHITGSSVRAGSMDTLRYYFIQVDNSSGINAIAGSKFSVNQNHPNPFSKNTLIEFYSPSGGVISLTVSNMLGKPISVRSMRAQPGYNRISLSARDFDAGVYFYTLINTDKQSVTKRMIVDNE